MAAAMFSGCGSGEFRTKSNVSQDEAGRSSDFTGLSKDTANAIKQIAPGNLSTMLMGVSGAILTEGKKMMNQTIGGNGELDTGASKPTSLGSRIKGFFRINNRANTAESDTTILDVAKNRGEEIVVNINDAVNQVAQSATDNIQTGVSQITGTAAKSITNVEDQAKGALTDITTSLRNAETIQPI
jgi:hypothetical protein